MPKADPVAIVLPPMVPETALEYRLERYSVQQAAAYLLLSRARVYTEVADGKLACRKDGNRRRRFSRTDLDNWRARHRVEITES